MIEVEVGNTIVEFPDGTPPEIMKAALQKQFGGGEGKKRSLAEKAVEPITSYPGTYNEMRNESVAQMGRGVDQVSTAISGEDAMGYPVDNRAWEAAKGVGNAAMGAVGFVGSPVNAALRTVAGKPIEENTGIPKELTEFAAALAIPGMGLRAANPAPMMAPARPVATASQEVAEAAARQGIDLPRAVTSDMMGVQQMGKIATNIPIGGTPLRQASREAVEGLGRAADDTQAAYGSGSVQGAGGAVQRGIETALESGPMKQRVNALYRAVDDIVDPTSTSELVNTQKIALTINQRRSNAALPPSDDVKSLLDGLTRQGMNYQGVKDLRSFFGEVLDKKIPVPAGMQEGEVRQLYGALSQDLRIVIAKSGGPDGLKAYDKAERVFKRWADIRENLVSVLKVKSDEAAFDKVLSAAGSSSRADIRLLGRVRSAVGADNWDEIASAAISKLGRDVEGNFSPDRFVTAYGKLSQRGKDMLFRTAGHTSHADALDDIATISSRFKSLNQFANPSGTGQTVAGTAMMGGAFVEPLTLVTSVVSARVISSLLARPAPARSMAAYSRAYARAVTNASPASIKGLENASRLFATSVGTELSRADLIPALTQRLQSLVPARAENEDVNPNGVTAQ